MPGSSSNIPIDKEKVVIAGGGLVGALAASAFADAGHKVDLYELRDDPRGEGAAAGRSINLTLSHRARRALRRIGMEQECLDAGVPLFGRMIHRYDGSTYDVPYGRTDEHYILSISRLGLNQMLLTGYFTSFHFHKANNHIAAEKRENVNLHFEHRVTSVDLKGQLTFKSGDTAQGDVLIGADGAFSKVRAQMARGRFDFQQHYIPHGYKGNFFRL